jgi:adenylate cyclase
MAGPAGARRAVALRWRALQIALPLLVLLGGIALRIADPGLLEELRLRTFDHLQTLRPRPYAAAPVLLVEIDDESLERVREQWPWPRWMMAELISRLQQAGASVVAVDILFAEADRSSPAVLLERLPEGALRQELEAYLARSGRLDHDRLLAEAVGSGGVVAGFMAVDQPDAEPRLVPKAGFAISGADIRPFLRRQPGVILSLPEIVAAAAGVGSLAVVPDSDGIVRRVPLIYRYDDFVQPPEPPCSAVPGSARAAEAAAASTAGAGPLSCEPLLLPALALDAVRLHRQARGFQVIASNASGIPGFGARTGIVALRVGQAEPVPTDGSGALWLYDSGPRAERSLPAWQVLRGEFDPARIDGRIVVLGATASGLGDRHRTGQRGHMPGPEVHAQIIEQMLTGQLLQRPDFSLGLEVVYMGALGLIVFAGFVARRPATPALSAFRGRQGIRGTLAFALVMATAVGLSWYAFTRHGWLLDPVYPSLVGVLTFLAALFATYLATEVERMSAEFERRRTRESLSRYMSKELVDVVVEQPELIEPPRYRDITTMFCDVRGFTDMSSRLDNPKMMFERVINPFLAETSRIVMDECHGIIDKYLGDGFMAFWNAPHDVPDHARQACLATIKMRRAMLGINARLNADAELQAAYNAHLEPGEAPALVQMRIGVGINTGETGVGNMGWERRADYSLVGQPVNLAARLEGQCKTFGVDSVIGEDTWRQAQDLAMLEIGEVQVKGEGRALRVFTLVGDDALAQTPEFQALAEAHAHMRALFDEGDLDGAARVLAECRRLAPALPLDEADAAVRESVLGLYVAYAARIEEARREALPAGGWSPVFVAKTK